VVTYVLTSVIFFLKYAGELHIIALREEDLGYKSQTTQTHTLTQTKRHGG